MKYSEIFNVKFLPRIQSEGRDWRYSVYKSVLRSCVWHTDLKSMSVCSAVYHRLEHSSWTLQISQSVPLIPRHCVGRCETLTPLQNTFGLPMWLLAQGLASWSVPLYWRLSLRGVPMRKHYLPHKFAPTINSAFLLGNQPQQGVTPCAHPSHFWIWKRRRDVYVCTEKQNQIY